MKFIQVNLLVFMVLFTGLTCADTLLIESVEKNSMVSRPDRGATMVQVESRYGRPASKVNAVGIPAITRWKYSDFTIYFENDRVIHTVINRH